MAKGTTQQGAPLNRLFTPVDIAWLALFRVVFGVIMLLGLVRQFADGTIAARWIEPSFHFGYFGLEWIRPLPGAAVYVHAALLAVLAACIAAGFLYRVAAPLFFLGKTWLFLSDAAAYTNSDYLACLIGGILVFLPAHRAWSLDALAGRATRCDTVPAWTLWLLRFQAGTVYFFGALARLHPDWLSGLPLKYWLADAAHVPVAGPFLSGMWVTWTYAVGSILFGFLIIPALLWWRTRLVALLFAGGFHLTNTLLLGLPVPWLLIAATLTFLDPGWPRHLGLIAKGANRTEERAEPRRGAAWLPAVLAAYVAAQVALPVRHWFMPGDVCWTEEGARFAWRPACRSKPTALFFRVTQPDTGETRAIDPEDVLPPWQRRVLPARPDMILQYAHHLAGRERKADGPRPRVTARALAALNGRMPRFLVATNLDLAVTPRRAGPDPWILPLTNAPTGGGSASELDLLQRRYDGMRKEIAALTNTLAQTAARIADVDRTLERKFAMKPDGLYYLDAASHTIFELRRKPGAVAEVASMTDIDRGFDRIHHLRLVTFNQSAELSALLGSKQKLGLRRQTLASLLAEKEHDRMQLLEELQDARLAAINVEPAAVAE